MSSLCCNAKTRIGYYNIGERPDIHGIHMEGLAVVMQTGTYCTKCEKLCDYILNGVEYFTNGIPKPVKIT